MNGSMVMSLSALLTLLPACFWPYYRALKRPDRVYWALLSLAFLGAAVYSILVFLDGWNTGFSYTLWVSIACSLAIFMICAAAKSEAWRLSPLLLPYLALLALLATIWSQSGPRESAVVFDSWLTFHVAVSVLTYALCTLAAVAAMAVFIQERALKSKRPNLFSRLLPAIVHAEGLQLRLLTAAEFVLLLGIISGMAERTTSGGALLAFDHKTLFSLLAFALIGALLLLHLKSGLRGRRAARLALIAYLLLTLAYPGVKFVTEVLVA
jgi:ABC-type uncharacterized transport system permease subunit